MSPRKLQNEIKQDFTADSAVWLSYKNSIASEFAQINYQDLSDHLLREFNRKIVNLGLNEDLMFTPFDSGFRFLGATIGSNLDPDAQAYINAISATGATVTSAQESAINTFITTGKTEGWYSSLKRLHLPIWQLAAANAICMKSLTSGTFTGTFDHGSRGTRSDGMSYFRTAGHYLTPLGISKSSYHISYMVTDPLDADSGQLAQNLTSLGETNLNWNVSSSYDNDNNIEFMAVNLLTLGFGASIVSYTMAGGIVEPMGVISVGGNGSEQYAKHRNILGVSTKATGSIVQSGSISELVNDFVGSQYGSGGSAAPRCGLLSIGTHMTTEQDSLFTAAAKALWENVTGQSLPTL